MIERNVIVLAVYLIVPIICTDILPSLPKGVPVSKLPLYDPLKDFTCLDGLFTVPFSYVNDDYCDCQDGSDEPGTSACPSGLFYCANKGFTPLTVPSSRVNDGFCDCCDASDEYLTNNCTDNCEELGRAAKEAAGKQAKLAEQGNLLRLQFVATAKRNKLVKQERVAALESEKIEAQKLKDETEQAKLNAETAENAALEVYRQREEAIKKEKAEQEEELKRKEAQEAFDMLDSNKDNILQIEEMKPRQIFDQNKDSEVSEEEIKFFLGDDKTEADFEYFISTVWPRLKPLYMLEKGIFVPPSAAQEGEEEVLEEPPMPDEQNLEEEEEAEMGDEEREENWEKEQEDNDMATTEQEHESDEVNIELEYDENTKGLIEEANYARAQFENAQKALREIEQELNQLKEVLAKDYGLEDEFAPLEGQCFSYTDREYTYKLCPFDHVLQSSKSSNAETKLGVWAGWAEQGSYDVMLYTKGLGCWNGPQRSAKVLVSCGLENALVGASEPNKCEYLLKFQTPAACRPLEKLSHDEL